jgi:hypothetical protein
MELSSRYAILPKNIYLFIRVKSDKEIEKIYLFIRVKSDKEVEKIYLFIRVKSDKEVEKIYLFIRGEKPSWNVQIICNLKKKEFQAFSMFTFLVHAIIRFRLEPV